jgi:hypothetical protein
MESLNPCLRNKLSVKLTQYCNIDVVSVLYSSLEAFKGVFASKGINSLIVIMILLYGQTVQGLGQKICLINK